MCRLMLDAPGDDGVTYDADTVRVGKSDRTLEEARFLNPCGAGHFTIAILAEPAGVDRIAALFAARKNHRNTRPNWFLWRVRRSVAGYQGGIPHLDVWNVGDGINRA